MHASRAAQVSAEVSREVLEAAHRPYVGVGSLKVENDRNNEAFRVVGTLTNRGTVAARSVKVTWVAILNGAPIKETDEQAAYTMNPGASSNLNIAFGQPQYKGICERTINFEVLLGADYLGIGTREYRYREKFRFNPQDETLKSIECESS